MASLTLFSICLTFIYLATVSGGRIRREGKNIKVTTLKEKPYLMKDGDKYTGFIPDILDKVSKKTNINFEFVLVPDGKYGMEKDGRWNGMVGQVKNGNAQMAAASMTTSEARKSVIDFTESFMSLGTTILFKKVDNPPLKTFKELSEQSDIAYGAVRDGMTQTFFERAENPVYKKIGDHFKSQSGDMQNNILQGVEEVRSQNGKYAFIMENTTAAYWLGQEPCNLMTLETVNVHNHYAFALQKNDPQQIKKKINDALIELRNNGDLKKLEDKWWTNNSQCAGGASYLLSHFHWVVLSSLAAILLR